VVTQRGARPLVDGHARAVERGWRAGRRDPGPDRGALPRYRAERRCDGVADAGGTTDRRPDPAAHRDADGAAHGHAPTAADQDAEADEHPEADREAHGHARRDADTRADANARRDADTRAHANAAATDARANTRPDSVGPAGRLGRVVAATAPDHSGRGSHTLAAATLPLP
jgi:hypothetical protein